MRRLCRPFVNRRCPSWLRHEHTGPRLEVELSCRTRWHSWSPVSLPASRDAPRRSRRRACVVRAPRRLLRRQPRQDGMQPRRSRRCQRVESPSCRGCCLRRGAPLRVVGIRLPQAEWSVELRSPVFRRNFADAGEIKPASRRSNGGRANHSSTTLLRCCRIDGLADSPLFLLSRLPSGPLRRAGFFRSNNFQKQFRSLL